MDGVTPPEPPEWHVHPLVVEPDLPLLYASMLGILTSMASTIIARLYLKYRDMV
jgi:hypothetical protein